MQICYDPKLLEYMKRKGLKNIVIEVASSNNSDFEVTELYFRLVNDKAADYMVEKRHFRAVQTDTGRILLPNYRLHYDDTVTFRLKTWWVFHSVRAEGVHL